MKKKAKILAMFFVALLIGQSDSSAKSMMYWTDLANNKIQRANLDGSGIRDLITTGLGNPKYIALDTAAGKMYWTDSGLDMIRRANLNGSQIEALVTTGLSSPGGIALDVDAGKMYWNDSITHKIQRANLNGSGVEDLVTTGLQWPQGIALDVTGGKMYWTDASAGTDKIQRANLDGSGVEDLITVPFGSGALQGIALDVSAGKMYWADLIKIQRANLDGSNIEFLVTTGGRLRGIALDVAAGKMYWTDTLWYGKIQCANLDGSGVKDLIVGGMNFPLGLALDVPKPPKIIYVDVDADGANNGSSWANAYNYLQDALAVAQSRDKVRVAQGTYKPDQGVGITAGDRTATFRLKNGVVIRGGYAGFGEPDPNAWDIELYETILSGDIGIAGNKCDNSYHVVTGSGTDGTAVLDGFIITGGNATDYLFHHYNGGGIFNYYGTPMLLNCIFIDNAAIFGGAVYNSDTVELGYRHDPTIIINCLFSGNLAHSNGGAISNCWAKAKIINCIFGHNIAQNSGGGIFNSSASSLTLTNCTFNGNMAPAGNALACDTPLQWYPSKLQIANSILWDGGEGIWNNDNSYIRIAYSDVQGGWPDVGNMDADPCFVEPGYWDANGTPNDPNDDFWIEGDYHLLPDSPCIDTGNNSVVPPDMNDLDGNPRVKDGDNDGITVVDMGAYEFFNTPPVADAGPDQVVECACNTEEGTKVILDGTGSYDADGDPLTYTWTGPFVESPAHGASSTVILEDGCPGEYVITLVVNDGIDDSEPNEVVITVVDTKPPEFTFSVTPTMLWPPDHKMVLITPSGTVSDECDASPDVSLISITMNEGDDTVGDGHTTDDIQIGEDGSIYLRSERSGTSNDRIYTITYQAVDDYGNTAFGSATVSIPHDFKVLARIAARWLWAGPAGRTPEDLNGDGVVNFADFAKFAENWIK